MATVEFKTHDDVLKAINKYDKFVYQGRAIFVRQDYPPPDKQNFGSGRSFDGEETDMAIRITVEIEIAQEVVMVVAVVAPVVLVVVMEEVITDLPCLQPLQELRFLLVTCHSQ